MSATWQMIPEELVTKIGDHADFGTKLLLSACSRAENEAIKKSRMTIKKVEIRLEKEQMNMEIEEENGQKWRIEPLRRRTSHPYESAYYELIEHLQFALSFTKEPVGTFSLVGEAYEYPEILSISKLRDAPEVHLMCSNQKIITDNWMDSMRNVRNLHYGYYGPDNEVHMNSVPMFARVENLSIEGFKIVNFRKILFTGQLKSLSVKGTYFENLAYFLQLWADPSNHRELGDYVPFIPSSFRSLRVTGPETGVNWSSVKYELRRAIRETGQQPDPEIERFVVRRTRDSAVGELEFGWNWLQFTFTPGKFEPLGWESMEVTEEEEVDEQLGNRFRRVLPVLRNGGEAGSRPGYWH